MMPSPKDQKIVKQIQTIAQLRGYIKQLRFDLARAHEEIHRLGGSAYFERKKQCP